MSTDQECKTLKGGKRVLTAPFRASFPSLFKPTSMDESQEKKYEVTMLFPKETDISALKKILVNALKEKWKKKPKNFKNPFRKGSEKPDLEGYKGTVFVKATAQRKPKIVDEKVEPITDEEKIYPGQWLRAVVHAFTWSSHGRNGVSFGLESVQIVKDDESFYGGGDPNEDYDKLDIEVDDLDDDDSLLDDDDDDDDDDVDLGV